MDMCVLYSLTDMVFYLSSRIFSCIWSVVKGVIYVYKLPRKLVHLYLGKNAENKCCGLECIRSKIGCF